MQQVFDARGGGRGRIFFDEPIAVSTCDQQVVPVESDQLYQLNSTLINEQIIRILMTNKTMINDGSIRVPITVQALRNILTMSEEHGWDDVYELSFSELRYWFCLTHTMRCKCSIHFARIFLFDFVDWTNFFSEPQMAHYLAAARTICQNECYNGVIRECLSAYGIPLTSDALKHWCAYIEEVASKNPLGGCFARAVANEDKKIVWNFHKKNTSISVHDVDFSEMACPSYGAVLFREKASAQDIEPTRGDVSKHTSGSADLMRFDLLSH